MSNPTFFSVDCTGYVFSTEQEAIDATFQVNEFYNSSTWTQYWIAPYDSPIFWFIMADDSLVTILGNPQNFSYLQLSPESNISLDPLNI